MVRSSKLVTFMLGTKNLLIDSGISWYVCMLCFCAIATQIKCLSILEHIVDPPVVSNCSAVNLTCQVDTEAPNVEVWWTFNGENASKLPDTTMVVDNADKGEWQLQLKCPTLEHQGSYACNAQGKNSSEIVYRKEALLRIYVPITIKLEHNMSAIAAGGKINLTCIVTGHPLPAVEWYKDDELITSNDTRFLIATREVAPVTVLSSLNINDLQRRDNGTYVCQAINEYTNATSLQNLLVEEPPEIEFLKNNITILNSSTVTLRWLILYDGNLPVSRFHLVQTPTLTDESEIDIDRDIFGNITEYTIENLLPGVTYNFRLSAANLAGASEYDYLNVSMPADVPPKVSWVHVLASTNETLLFGWRRPIHDNGANITHYTVELHHHNNSLVANTTIVITGPGRNNHMYVFVNLDPGETYIFQVQACNSIGCGSWSEPLEGTTSDGTPDPPQNIEIKCDHDFINDNDSITVRWDAPHNARGTILSYNVTLFSRAQYRSENGQTVEEKSAKIDIIDVKGNKTEYRNTALPNTEYTVQMCTINRSGCGPMTNITADTKCKSLPNIPSTLPPFYMQRKNSSDLFRQLELKLQPVNERNGSILCYKVIIIRLPKGLNMSKLPDNPETIHLLTSEKVNKNIGHGAYIAEAFSADNFMNEITIGDNIQNTCNADKTSFDIQDLVQNKDIFETETIQDGTLAPNNFYTGYVSISVKGPNETILTKKSPYFSPVLTGSLPKPTTQEHPVMLTVAVVCGLILVVVAIVLAVFCLRHKHISQYSENGERLGLRALIRSFQSNGHLPIGKGGPLSKTPKYNLIAADDLPAAFIERHVDSDLLFQAEFESLPDNNFKDRTTHASDAPENLSKNRYPDIKAYDQTRVKLPFLEGVPGSDYINANFIEGYRGRKMFICAQGPLERTITDFWRMIWEHRVSVVVMLTGIEELGQVKCAQYWNDNSSKEIEKMFVITITSTKQYSDYIIRRFHVEFTKDGFTEEREVLHFHFVLWKDFLAPEQPSWLLRFIKRVNEHYCSDRGPLLVHCSAGVGRTGTFVAIDSLLQQLEDEGRIDVFLHVSTLRHQRNYLVQSLEQYIFVYRALMEHAQFGDTEIEVRHLRDHYQIMKETIGDTGKSGLAMEFEKLGEVIEDPKSCNVGTMDINIEKNRYDFIIPYDRNRVILAPSPFRDHSFYINASFIQGYDRSLSFIITQDPLESTVIEFWRMIKEQNVTTLVMLSEIGEGQTKCQPYWPTEDEEKMYDHVKVAFKSEENLQFYFKREFSVLNTKNADEVTLTQFQFKEWPFNDGSVPDGTLGLLILIENVQLNQEKQAGSGPITVHCSGGGGRSSVFVTLCVLIQQLKAEERVDIFQAARYTRSQRHCMLQTLSQYDFLYKGLLEYIHSRNICDMGDTQL